MHATFVPDIFACANACAQWNVNGTFKCVGVSWGTGSYGPRGPDGGNQCFLKWSMQGSPTTAPTVDDARLQVVVNSSTSASASASTTSTSTSISTVDQSPTSTAASSTSTDETPESSSLSKTVIGGIVGGTIGGLALASVIIILVFVFILQKRKTSRESNSVTRQNQGSGSQEVYNQDVVFREGSGKQPGG